MKSDNTIWAGPSIAPSLDDLAEIYAVEKLAKIYGLGIDMRDYKLCRSAFSDDAVGFGREGSEPIDEYLHNTYKMAESFHATQHVIANQYVDLNGDYSVMWSYGIAHHKVAPGEERDEIIAGVQYRDKCKRTPGGWLIVERRVNPLWLDMKRVA